MIEKQCTPYFQCGVAALCQACPLRKHRAAPRVKMFSFKFPGMQGMHAVTLSIAASFEASAALSRTLKRKSHMSNSSVQPVELKVSKVVLVGPCDNSAGKYALAKKKMTMEVGQPCSCPQHCCPYLCCAETHCAHATLRQAIAVSLLSPGHPKRPEPQHQVLGCGCQCT